MSFNQVLYAYIAVISLISVIATIVDKRNAIRGRWRISEDMLFVLASLGGSVAMYITMRLIHHKTRYKKFMLGLPLVVLIQGVVLWYLLR